MTPAEANEKYRLALHLNLSGAELLADTDAVCRQCNGIGAAWFPDWLRWFIGVICPHLVIVADIHDRRYSIGGNQAARRLADTEFVQNTLIVAEAKWKWFPPMRWLTEQTGWKMYRVLRAGGALAWRSCGRD